MCHKLFFVFLAGVLLFFSFPPLEFEYLAWVAVLPLIYLCFSVRPGEAFRAGLLAGLVFWLASICWLTRVSFIGWLFISLYCALYCAVFAWLVCWWQGNYPPLADRNGRDGSPSRPKSEDRMPRRGIPTLMHRKFKVFVGPLLATCRLFPSAKRIGTASASRGPTWKSDKVALKFRAPGRSAEAESAAHTSGPNLILLFGVPAIWVGLEYARAHFLTGFPWNPLGVSQYANRVLIQCADWGGVYLVSYLIVLGNTAGALAFSRCQGGAAGAGKIIGVFFLAALLALGYGNWRLGRPAPGVGKIKVAAVQANVPQAYKWSEEAVNDIYDRLKRATEKALRAGALDLIVWPETALPDFGRYSLPSRQLVAESLQGGVPLLAGSMDYEELPQGLKYFNSAFLFIPGRDEPQVYAKRHLVPFGEYVPGARYFPFLRALTGIEEDFTPGAENVILRLADERRAFSVLICFEDTLPYLARAGVRAGARLLINQTNDAWFDPSWASRQHMAHCVFRCVENRVGCLRATNTGLTCFIDRAGVIGPRLEPLGREGRPPEVLPARIDFSPPDMPLSFYTRQGDLFALACAAFSLPVFLGALLNLVRQRRI